MQFSVVTSIYKDGYLARDFCREIASVFSEYLNIDKKDLSSILEIILVNDGSPDNSLQILLDIKSEFEYVKVVDLSRNFGQHQALACGFRIANGQFVIRVNVDMQDHPRELPKLLEPIVNDRADLAIGQYSVRNSPWLNGVTAFIYFETFKFLTGLRVHQQTSPMRVMNRLFIDAYNGLTEKSRFPQGLDNWLGFRQVYLRIDHLPRSDGKSSYNFRSRTALAVTGILYFTDRPLKLIGLLGLWIAVFGVLLGMGVIILKMFGSPLIPGYASIASIVLIGFGLQIGLLGIIGLYIGRIFREVQNRPLYIVRKTFF